MTTTTLQQTPALLQDIRKLIDEGELSAALSSTSVLLDKFDKNNDEIKRLRQERESIAETYRHLLRFFIDGVPDSGRAEMTESLSGKLRAVADRIERESLSANSNSAYFTALRYSRLNTSPLKEHIDRYISLSSHIALSEEAGGDAGKLRKEKEAELVDIFRKTMVTYAECDDSYHTLRQIMSDETLPFELRAHIVSALLLGNLNYFDEKGIDALIETAALPSHDLLSARAMTAVALIVKRHGRRLASNRRLSGKLDSMIAKEDLKDALMNVAMARDTDRIVDTLNKSIFPDLMKISPEILKKIRKSQSDAELFAIDENPEWEKIMKENGLEDKLRELSEMQMEGGDVMMGAFSRLKMYPFFREPANWFLPFDPRHSDLSSNSDLISMFSTVLDANPDMCDNDKYSFGLSLGSMPDAQRSMMRSQMEAQLSQLKEAMNEQALKNSDETIKYKSEAKRFMRDIYRYCKIKDDSGLGDFLSAPFDMSGESGLPWLGSDSGFLLLTGEFHFKRKYYDDALKLFTLYLNSDAGNADVMEKAGYSAYMEKDIDKALEWYLKAEYFKPDNRWLMRQLGMCLKLTGRYGEAREYYEKALAYDPDNYKIIMNLGHCCLEQGDADGAAKHYYHADYVRPESMKPKRALAWAELLRRNYEKSDTFYGRLLSGKAVSGDYLNAGHLNLIRGNIKTAVELYRKYAEEHGIGIAKFRMDFAADTSLLSEHGVTSETLSLIPEAVGMILS